MDSPSSLSPDKRRRKIPEKFRDHFVQELTSEHAQRQSADLPLNRDTGSGEQQKGDVPTTAAVSGECEPPPPVKRKRGRPPKIRPNFSTAPDDADQPQGNTGSWRSGCALCSAVLSERSAVKLHQRISGFTATYLQAIKEASSGEAIGYLADSSGQLCSPCGHLAKNIFFHLNQVRVLKERLRYLLGRQLARKQVTEADLPPQEDRDLEEEAEAFLKVEDFLDDVSNAYEMTSDSQEAGLEARDDELSRNPAEPGAGVSSPPRALKRKRLLDIDEREEKTPGRPKKPVAEKPSSVSSVSFNIGEATWANIFSMDPAAGKETMTKSGVETLKNIAQEFFKTCQLACEANVAELTGRCLDEECGLLFSLRSTRRLNVRLRFSGTILHTGKSQPRRVCDYCCHNFGVGEDIVAHMQKQHADRLFLCSCCKTFTSRESRNAHKLSCGSAAEESAAPSTPATSDLCPPAQEESGTTHRATPPGCTSPLVVAAAPRVFCDKCKRPFASARNLRDHMNIVHADHDSLLDSLVEKYSFPCETCGKVFRKKSNLQSHSLSHTAEKPFQCDQPGCDSFFKRLAALNEHRRVQHSPGDRQSILCIDCGLQFQTASGLRMHRNTKHPLSEGAKPSGILCEICQKSFRTKSDLATHNVVHTKEKLFECGECGVKFSRKNSLQQHENVHAEKYRCQTCGKCFGRQKYLLHHRSICQKALDQAARLEGFDEEEGKAIPGQDPNPSGENPLLAGNLSVARDVEHFVVPDLTSRPRLQTGISCEGELPGVVLLEATFPPHISAASSLLPTSAGLSSHRQQIDVRQNGLLPCRLKSENEDDPPHSHIHTAAPTTTAWRGQGAADSGQASAGEQYLGASIESLSAEVNRGGEVGLAGHQEEAEMEAGGAGHQDAAHAEGNSHLSWEMTNVDLGAEETLETVQNMQEGEIIEANLVAENGELGVPIRLVKGPGGSLNMLRDGKLVPLVVSRQ